MKPVIAVMSDLFFSASINDAAKRLGASVAFVKDKDAALQRMRLQPAVLILDLNCTPADPLALIASIKRDPELAGTTIVGFVSHVQTELKRKAQESGCDLVLARSVFAQNVQEILARYIRLEPVPEAD